MHMFNHSIRSMRHYLSTKIDIKEENWSYTDDAAKMDMTIEQHIVTVILATTETMAEIMEMKHFRAGQKRLFKRAIHTNYFGIVRNLLSL